MSISVSSFRKKNNPSNANGAKTKQNFKQKFIKENNASTNLSCDYANWMQKKKLSV